MSLTCDIILIPSNNTSTNEIQNAYRITDTNEYGLWERENQYIGCKLNL